MPAATSALTLPNDDPSPANMRDWEAVRQAALVLATHLYAMAKRRDRSDLPSTVEEVRIGGTNLCIRYELVQSADDDPTTTGGDLLTHGLPAIAGMQRKCKLTHTETRVAMLLVERKTNREIANSLDVTEYTARRHTEHVMKKLKVHHRAHVQQAFLAASDSPPPRLAT